jgi:AcrR family transcriptional regulator
MNEINAKKQKMLIGMAAHVLTHGLNTASLRPLAKAIGTSDRMLIYHFGSKEGLITALLHHLAQMFITTLNAALPPKRAATRLDCVRDVITLQRRPEVAGFMRIWFDIISVATQENTPHREAAHQIIFGFVEWLKTRLPENEPDPNLAAKSLLTLIEGVGVMDGVGHQDMSDAAIEWLLGDHVPD